jgi:prepilin-type N-terminal cleavage/methylation domain-containing protein
MQLATLAPRTPAARRGFSLTELMIALVLVGIVGTAVSTVLVKQQRYYRTAGDLLETRSQIRQAVSTLPADLRSVSSSSGDIRAMSASSIDFDATIGGGVVCQASVVAAGAIQDVYLLPRESGGGSRYTTWASAPQPGDRAVVYNEAGNTFSAPVALVTHMSGSVVDNAAAAAACTNSWYLTPAENALTRPWVRLNLGSTVPATSPATRGMPIRFLRRVRYSLTQAADDREWYLGYEEFDAAGAARPMQIMSGPYRPLAADTTSGLTFAYYNADGAVLPFTATTQVARVEIVVRGLTRGTAPQSGSVRADGRLADSDQLNVGLRN